MTDDLAVNTAENSQKPNNGKPFAKGKDSRRNLKGRPRVPKSAVELNKLIDEIAGEDVVNPATGEQVQRLRAMLRSMMTGKDSRGKVEILNRRFGKVKEEVNLTNSDGSLTPAPLPDEERLARMKQLAVMIADEVKKINA